VNQLPPAFDIIDLDGTVSIIETHIDDRIVVSGDGRRAHVLALGIFCEKALADCFTNVAMPPAEAALLQSRRTSLLPGTGSVQARSAGRDDAAFIRTMLDQARREVPSAIASLPTAVTDVRIFRVWVTSGLVNVTVTGASGPSTR
jgi:hypothetical protein